jgi:hypothetical protein
LKVENRFCAAPVQRDTDPRDWCTLSHPEWGQGVAEGVAVPPLLLEDGRVKVAVRNVLTFPPI